nr:hypothetical protein [Tanacetum cinerariifolium]
MRMRDFAMWDWGILSHRVLGEVIGTVQVEWSAQEKAVGRWAFWREKQLV